MKHPVYKHFRDHAYCAYLGGRGMWGPEFGETCLYNTCTLLYIALSPASFFNDMKNCRSGWPDAYPRFLSVCEIVIFFWFFAVWRLWEGSQRLENPEKWILMWTRQSGFLLTKETWLLRLRRECSFSGITLNVLSKKNITPSPSPHTRTHTLPEKR